MRLSKIELDFFRKYKVLSVYQFSMVKRNSELRSLKSENGIRRVKMKKKLLSIGLIAVMALGLFGITGCGGSDESADQDNTLVVGLDDTFAPMGFRDEDGNIVGFDIDLANAVGEELGMDVEFQPIDWNAKRDGT